MKKVLWKNGHKKQKSLKRRYLGDFRFFGIIRLMINYTGRNYSTEQGRLPVYISEMLDIYDPVIVFDQIMEEIGIEKYLKPERARTWLGRPRYNRVRMLKTVLYGFRKIGYGATRKLEDKCKVNIRYMYLMNYETPCYHTFSSFIKEELEENIEEIFKEVMAYIIEKDHVDMQHVYIDGSKFEANANKYTWVWKSATEKSRYKLFRKITAEIEKMNDELSVKGIKIDTNMEYTPAALEMIVSNYLFLTHADESTFKKGKGKRKSAEQRHCEKLRDYAAKLQKYIVQINTCGEERNSYSKTDPDATFMRMKKDYMGNDQLLPAYNIQIAVADEYIVALDVQQYRSDMDCFVPLMEKFHELYGFYPQYPVADAGYGSYNNYLYCREHGMGLYMKFPMYRKETKDKKYHNNPFRAVNFRTDEEGNLICPNGKKFQFSYRKPVKGNKYGRQEEIYQCEDCTGCPYAAQCKKGEGNRTVSLNEELTAIHQEVLDNLESIHGALLRMNRSIQAEGSFGIMKYDRWYKRIEAVKEVRSDDKWRREYMVLIERDRENRRLGEHRIKVAQVRNSRNSVDIGTLSLILMIHPHTLQEILDTIDAHPNWSDEKVAESVEFV